MPQKTLARSPQLLQADVETEFMTNYGKTKGCSAQSVSFGHRIPSPRIILYTLAKRSCQKNNQTIIHEMESELRKEIAWRFPQTPRLRFAFDQPLLRPGYDLGMSVLGKSVFSVQRLWPRFFCIHRKVCGGVLLPNLRWSHSKQQNPISGWKAVTKQLKQIV